jgi:hypothetical protein
LYKFPNQTKGKNGDRLQILLLREAAGIDGKVAPDFSFKHGRETAV